MTLDEVEHQKLGFYGFFWLFWAVRHFSRANCFKIHRDRQGHTAHEIFSIEHRFRQFKSQFFTFKETCARGRQRAVSS